MEQVAAESTARIQFNAMLLTILALIALLLATLGVYGLTTYSVERRTREIGIRMAIGAEPGEIRAMVLAESFWLAITGIGSGGAAALVLARWMGSLIYGMKASLKTLDPAVLAFVALLMAAAALVAAYIPARRATLVDPVHALKVT